MRTKKVIGLIAPAILSSNHINTSLRRDAASVSKNKRKPLKCIGLMLALLAALSVMSGCSTSGPSRSMLTMMTDLVDAEESLDKVWPGYYPSARHFAVYREGRDVLLISRASELEGFERLDNQRLKSKAWYDSAPESKLGGAFALAADFGGVSGTAVREDLGLVTMIHEDFHSFQSESWGRVELESRLDVFNKSNSSELAIGFDLETSTIMNAWKSNGETQREYLLDYLALRYIRESRMTDEQVLVERHFELTEGTATYVDLKASSILGFAAGQRLRSLQDDLTRTDTDTMQMLVRRRSYGIGLMLSIMLDKWTDGSSWKLRVSEERATLSTLLAEALEIEHRDLEARGNELLSKHEFEIKLARQNRRRANLQSRIGLTRYLWQMSFSFVAELDEGSGGHTGSVSFRTGGIHHLPDGWTLVPMPTSYSVQFAGQNLKISRHPVISRSKPNNEKEITEVVVLLRRPPRMSSGHLEAGEHMLSGQPFRERGIDLDANEPIKVQLQLIEGLDAIDFPWVDLLP